MDNENTAIELSQSSAITNAYFSPVVWKQMKEMATTFIESKALPQNIQNAAQAIMVMQAGYEMGMKPLESVKSLYIVNGQINIWGAALIRRLREHGWTVDYKMGTERGGSATAIIKKDKQRYEQTAYFEAAEKSGYTKDREGHLKVGWREGANRELKLKYLAISMLIKTKVSEVLGSISDIKEVAEDYPEIKTEIESPKKEETTVITGTDNEKRGALNDFLKNSKVKKEKVEEGEVVETSPSVTEKPTE